MKNSLHAAVTAMSILLTITAAAGHRVAILGDSYSTFAGSIPAENASWYPRRQTDVTKAEECWWSLVIAGIGGKLERNESWSGTCVCNSGHWEAHSFIKRTGKLGNPTLILVCGGTNDSGYKVPLGEYKWENWTEEDLKAFRPAMAKMLSDLRNLYPKAKVVFVLNTGLSSGINESVLTVCRHYQVPCTVLMNIDKQDGHPSVAGMKAMADQVILKLAEERIF